MEKLQRLKLFCTVCTAVAIFIPDHAAEFPPFTNVTIGLLPIKEAYVSVAPDLDQDGSKKKLILLSFFSTVYPIA